jgi:hypothetical protein
VELDLGYSILAAIVLGIQFTGILLNPFLLPIATACAIVTFALERRLALPLVLMWAVLGLGWVASLEIADQLHR